MSIFRLASNVNLTNVSQAAPESPSVVFVTSSNAAVDNASLVRVLSRAELQNSTALTELSIDANTRDEILAATSPTATGNGDGSGNSGKPPSAPEQLAAALGALTVWLPAEIIAAYAVFVTMMQPTMKGDAPVYSLWLWLIALVATPLTLAITTWAQNTSTDPRSEPSKERLRWSIGLSPMAFVLWSASVPDSAWNLFPWFKANSAIALFALLVVTGLFTLVATKLTGQTPSNG